jgi:hypothetical protein
MPRQNLSTTNTQSLPAAVVPAQLGTCDSHSDSITFTPPSHGVTYIEAEFDTCLRANFKSIFEPYTMRC